MHRGRMLGMGVFSGKKKPAADRRTQNLVIRPGSAYPL
jgi:hypothetical protein